MANYQRTYSAVCKISHHRVPDFADELMVSELVPQNLQQLCRSCDESFCLQSGNSGLVYVGYHVTSRNRLLAEYIDFSQQSKDISFFVLSLLA